MNNLGLFIDTEFSVDETFVLDAIEMYNWGPFGGRHFIEINSGGTAIIGATGSGKTTIIDALMTLIVASPRYNLASTGGHESDRDLLSYIRGVSGAGNESGDNRHVARTGKTVSGLTARFVSGEKSVQIGVLFWIDSASFANADRKNTWLFSNSADSLLDNCLTLHNEGGARALKQFARDSSTLKTFDTKKSYLVHIRRFFEVGENAFTLLNRAAGLKQLNSIDEIFRDLVLDDRSMFDRAAEVASEFDDLTAIYQELVIARLQQQSLAPISLLDRKYRTLMEANKNVKVLLQAFPVWFALQGKRLWGIKCEEIQVQLQAVSVALDSRESALREQAKVVDACHEQYLNLGGGTIERLNEQIVDQQVKLAERQDHANDYQKVTKVLNLESALDEANVFANIMWAREQEALHRIVLDEHIEALYRVGAEKALHASRVDDLQAELTEVEARPNSSIPYKHQNFRAQLADSLGTASASLPFIAELIEVKPESNSWRGAIERALGGHRLRILVPAELAKRALSWINQRDNKLHVRLLEVTEGARAVNFLSDGFVRKLTFKQHALRESMKSFLSNIDLHCVDTAEALRAVPHALTIHGMTSGVSGRFEKKDQQSLTQGWVTGFSNEALLANLTESLALAKGDLQQSQQAYRAARKVVDGAETRQKMLGLLQAINFESIDVVTVESRLLELGEQLSRLLDPDSGAGQARIAYERACGARDDISQDIKRIVAEDGGHKERLKQAKLSQDEADHRIGSGLTDELLSLVEGHAAVPKELDVDSLGQQERATLSRLNQDSEAQLGKLGMIEKNLVRQMEFAKKNDRGALAEVTSELQDIPAYLERLRVLSDEALPEKIDRFKTYLNKSSDEGVTQLLAEIDTEVAAIEERIEDLNHTLKRVDFQEQRYLKLVPRRVTHESLRTLERARNQLRSAVLKDDQGESQYKALENLVKLLREASETKRILGSRALLDPRYRLQFAYSVIDRNTGDVIETRTGSQGGSGGEKEIIASYILTASLSYALCPDGSSQPLFGTVILDEAFSKSSQVVAGRIIAALKEFGLHPLFVTPNKEMRLLREHTRSAVLVHRKGLQSSLMSLSWEEIDAYTKQKKQNADEIA